MSDSTPSPYTRLDYFKLQQNIVKHQKDSLKGLIQRELKIGHKRYRIMSKRLKRAEWNNGDFPGLPPSEEIFAIAFLCSTVQFKTFVEHAEAIAYEVYIRFGVMFTYIKDVGTGEVELFYTNVCKDKHLHQHSYESIE